MKKLLALLLALMFVFSLCGCSSEEVTEPVEEPALEVSEEVVVSDTEETEEDSETYLVYRTKSGTKYHRDGCIHLKSKYELTLEEAESRGLTPCSVCQP